MGKSTEISWCDHTFNPWWGCQRWSAGCENCYAETLAKRWGHNIWGPPSTTERRFFGDQHWAEPLKWDSDAAAAGLRRRVFCASMADVFEDHSQLPPVRRQLWNLIEQTPNLDWLLLTKRPENIAHMLPDKFWPNIWLGTSAENQHYYDTRVPILIQNTRKAAALFVSVEPMLGPIDLGAGFNVWCGQTPLSARCHPATDTEPAFCSEAMSKSDYLGRDPTGQKLFLRGQPKHEPCREPIIDYVDWIIVGGESGPRHRPFYLDWARECRDVCQRAGKAFFFKQIGGRTHAAGGCDLDGREWKEFPEPRRKLARA